MRRIMAIAVAALATLSACSRQTTLTRDKALLLISRSSEFTPAAPRLVASSAEMNCGMNHGFWRQVGNDPLTGYFSGRTHFALTTKGQKVFKEISSYGSEGQAAELVLTQQYPRDALEVIGIAEVEPPLEGWKGQEVQFIWKWRWNQFPDVLKQCGSAPPAVQSKALFRLYDDGWRFERLETF